MGCLYLSAAYFKVLIKKAEKKVADRAGFGMAEILGIAAVLIVAAFVVIPGFTSFADKIIKELGTWYSAHVSGVLFPEVDPI